MEWMDYHEEIRKIAGHHFRAHPDADEMIDRVLTLSYFRWEQLRAQGRLDDRMFRAALGFTIRTVRAGRTLERQSRKVDPVEKAVSLGRTVMGVEDPHHPADTAILKVDVDAYRTTLTDRKRTAFDMMVEGRENPEIREAIGISMGRVSQLRREFWEAIKNM